ncbi:Peptide chain release factor 1, mitochondrial [Collichthys lucidus]|uniref:Peptide chain release factor 1, mitochondrial n=1 Tax=Collichthys lucidus TaxID=240159 RepID=A0A4U5TVY5_COLLU|nr:Peptide chain release factor 1, mitochondrial [Collichthys lucidus]
MPPRASGAKASEEAFDIVIIFHHICHRIAYRIIASASLAVIYTHIEREAGECSVAYVMPDVCGDRRTGLQPAGTREEDEQVMQLLREEEARISSQISALRKDYVFISIHMCSGDVCQQFTREMYDMYQGFASYENWDFEVLNYTNAEYGGLHHAAVRIAGENVYRHLKHEGGTHRVRRIPEVGLSSRMQRIHTGTMTVIILPQPVEMGMRSPSDGIRTYNFSQDRITDHRTGYVARDIKEFMRGGEALDDLICDVRHDVAVYPYAISSKLHLREQHPDRADLQACMPVFKSFAARSCIECRGRRVVSEHPDREERTRRKHAERRRPVPAGTPGDGGGGSALLLTVQE